MKCTVCGAEVADGIKFCENCGAPLAAASAAAGVAAAAASAATPEPAVPAEPVQQTFVQPQGDSYWQGGQQQYQQPGYDYQQQQYQQPSYNYQQPAQWGQQPPTSRALAMSVYIGSIIVLIIALVVRDKNDPFMTHHLNQALVMFIGSIIAAITSIFIIGIFLGLFLFVMMIMGMVRAYNSSMEELPLIGKIHILK